MIIAVQTSWNIIMEKLSKLLVVGQEEFAIYFAGHTCISILEENCSAKINP